MNKQHLAPCLGLAGFVMVLVAQPVQADTVKVTAVELNPTSKGIDLVLSTSDSRQLQVFSSSDGKTFVANIVNTQLQLADDDAFRQDNPITGIASVSVTSVNANSVRIVVTGEAELPKVQVQKGDRGLVLIPIPENNATNAPPGCRRPSATSGGLQRGRIFSE